MADKIKILFVTTEFYQSGAERFMYEADTAIDRQKFDITILSILPLNHSKLWSDHYYELHRALGTPVHFLDDVKKAEFPSLKQRINKKLFGHPIPDPISNLRSYLDGFDAISFWGQYAYPELSRFMSPAQKSKSFIHVMSSRFQKADIFQRFDKSEHYHFVSGFGDEEMKFELQEFTSYDIVYFPPSINMASQSREWKFSAEPVKKIGIFTRLSARKPLDPFIYSFHLLLKHFPQAELHIFGTGDPVEEGMFAYVQHLRLEDKVTFRGHTGDIKKTAVDEKMDIVWFQGYHGIPGGFAGFDICHAGIPQLFWNFGTVGNASADETFPMTCDLLEFVEMNRVFLTDKVAAENLSQKQYEYVLKNRDIMLFLPSLQNAYISVRDNGKIK